MTKKEKVAKVMSEFYKQELHSSSGEVVKNPKQAIAIALSEAGLSKKHKSGGALSEHKTFYVPVIIDKNDRWEIVGHPSESKSEAQSKLTKIPRGSVGKVINRDEVLEHWSTRGREYLKDGGNIDNENALMVANNNKQIAHHTKEMQELLKENKNIPAWVVAKVNRSASDLSDATHYMEGEGESFANTGEYAKGGSIDKVSMNVPFLIRALEYSKEEAPDDIDLHKKVESIVNASQEGKTLEMKDYNTIFADGGKIDTSIPKEIYNQIGSKAFYMLGAKNIVALSNYTLAFRIRGSKKVNYVKVTLNSLDLYDVEYGKIHASKYKVVSEDKGIYNDMLLKSIERNTGLYTRLFGKGGNITPKFALYEHIYKETPNGTILGKIMEVIDNGSDIEYYVFYNYPKHDLVREQEADLYSTSDND